MDIHAHLMELLTILYKIVQGICLLLKPESMKVFLWLIFLLTHYENIDPQKCMVMHIVIQANTSNSLKNVLNLHLFDLITESSPKCKSLLCKRFVSVSVSSGKKNAPGVFFTGAMNTKRMAIPCATS